jgi:Fe-S cluster assembly protein SufD
MSAGATSGSSGDAVRSHYAERFDGFRAERPGEEAPWLGALRADAMQRFQALGFPTTRHEDWRYTNVATVAKRTLELQAESPDAGALRDAVAASRIPGLAVELQVFVDGLHRVDLSNAGGSALCTSLRSLRAADASALEALLGSCTDRDDALAALNTAFLDDGAVVRAPAGEACERVVHLLFLSTGQGISHPRLLVCAEPNSRLTIVQDHVQLGDGAAVTNGVSEVLVADGAAVDLVLLQRQGDASTLFTSTRARQQRGSRFASHTVTLGGQLVRNHLAASLLAEGAECSLRGLFMGQDSRHIDNHTLADHAAPHCTSHELYKGVLDDSSRGVFRGRVLVRKDAQKTDAVQSNPNLLLSDSAEIDSKPQLEIYADDVRCNHGSAIGRLDPDALFYLRSRGIGEPEARRLLMQGFALEITGALPRPELCEGVRTLIFGEVEDMAGVLS